MSHTNGWATSGRVNNVAPPRSNLLEGPDFALTLTLGEGGVDVELRGRPAPEQVLRLLAQSAVLVGDGEHIHVRIDTTEGYDEYTYTADLRHRLLFRRAWDRPGRVGVFYGLNPFVGDTDGPVDKIPGRATLRNVVGILSQDGPLARIDVMNVFTYRSADAASLPARPEDRVAVPQIEREVLSEADVVLLAWGSKVDHRHRAAIEQLLSVLASVGVAPSMLSRGGALLTVGQPPQPAHPARLGYHGIQAVPVGAETVLGRTTPAPSPVSAPAVAGSQPIQSDSRVSRMPPPAQSEPTRPDASKKHTGTGTVDEALAWGDAHLDPLGREAVRRFLAGEQYAPTHPDVPPPSELLRRAHEAGGPRDALDLAVAAHRIATGIAWRWIGARYLLVDSVLSPDLEDRRSDGKKVTGKPYADAAREAISRLVRSSAAVGNELAPGNARGLSFAEVARRWNISDDLAGATLGLGAMRWLEPAATQVVGHDHGATYYRVVASNAAWAREGS